MNDIDEAKCLVRLQRQHADLAIYGAGYVEETVSAAS
jgi:hypothetical protein